MDVVVNGIKDKAPEQCKPLSGQGDFYQNVLLCLGYEAQHLPLADLLKHYHQLSGEWLIATPVHWEATHNDAMLTAGPKELGLFEKESRLWFDEVANFLKEDGFTPVYHDALTWLFNVEGKPQLSSKSVNTMLHQSLMPVLNTLDSSLYWPRLITEVQMYLSAHRLNLPRSANLTINGLWFWGQGALQIKENRVIITDDEILERWSAARAETLSANSQFAKNQIVIIQDPKQIKVCDLEKKIKKNQVNWYWNNCSYSMQASPWWLRLWS